MNQPVPPPDEIEFANVPGTFANSTVREGS